MNNEDESLSAFDKTQQPTDQTLLVLLNEIKTEMGEMKEKFEQLSHQLEAERSNRGEGSTVPQLPPTPDPLREELAPELDLLCRVQATASELQNLDWLEDVKTSKDGRQLVRLLVRAAQWDEIIRLWDLLAERCKRDEKAASKPKQKLLAEALAVHNQRWTADHQASLIHVSPGTPYDFEQHQRGNTTGNTIRAEWLPGLRNAGGNVVKKPLVETK